MVFETIVFLGSSIAVARYLGPEKLGRFSYINFFIAVVQRTGGNGLSVATRKYLSEYIALEKLGIARAVYNYSYRIQLIFSVGFAALGIVCVLIFGDPQYRLMSCILLVSVVPGLMSWVPAQANQALEDVSKNTASAFGYLVSYLVIIVLTIHFHWDLVGVASAGLVGRTIEVVWRTIPLNRILSKIPLEELDEEIKNRMKRFSIEAIGVQIIVTAAFDRTELLFLHAYSSLEQLAFYSVSYSLTSNLQTPCRILANATGVTLMVDAVRDPARVKSIVGNASRFTLLVIFSISLGAAAITLPAVLVAYGPRYSGAVPALVVACILGIPRAFQWAPDTLLRIADGQKRLLIWYGITAVFNVAIDFLLIPHYGAVGAAWGNGLGATFGVIATWMQAKRYFEFEFPTGAAIRIGAASVIMAAVAYFIGHKISGILGLTLAIIAAVVVYMPLLRIFSALQVADAERLAPIGNKFPGPLRRAYLSTISFVTAHPIA